MLNIKYKNKYIKYKAKYLHLKRGGTHTVFMDEADIVPMYIDPVEMKKRKKTPRRVKKKEVEDFRVDPVAGDEAMNCQKMFKVKLKPGQFKYGCIHENDCYIGSFFSIFLEMTPWQFRDISINFPKGINDEIFKDILKQFFNIDIEISEQIQVTIREIYNRMYICLENGEFTIITISPSQDNSVLKHIIVITKYEGHLVLIDRQDNHLTATLNQVNVDYNLNKYEYLGFDNIVLYLTSYLGLFLSPPIDCNSVLYYQELKEI